MILEKINLNRLHKQRCEGIEGMIAQDFFFRKYRFMY